MTARHDVQYFPSLLSSFSPTTSRVCRIPLTSGTKSLLRRHALRFQGACPPITDPRQPHGLPRTLSLEGVSQMVYILPERLLALVRPAFDLVLRRIRSLKRCAQACGCKIMTPRYACKMPGSCVSARRAKKNREKKEAKPNQPESQPGAKPNQPGAKPNPESQPGAKPNQPERGIVQGPLLP